MISFLQALILGIVQGITEWLPISSSGHLVLFQNFFNIQAPLSYDILLHLGSLVVITLVFWKDIIKTLKAFFTLDFKSEYGKLSLFIILGSIATAIIGFTFKETFSNLFHNQIVVGLALIITGLLLHISKYTKTKKQLNAKNSILIGLIQGLALIPGLSRSGSTISVGLLAGIERKKLIRFSFMLVIPSIIGAMVFEHGKVAITDISVLAVTTGLLASIIVGYLCLKWAISLISKNKFHNFSWYCWGLGIIIILLYLI